MSNIERAKSIEGYMDELELEWLATQAKDHKCIVEIGSYFGRSTVALAENTDGEVYALDNWKGLQEPSLPVDTRTNLYEIFLKNVNGLVESKKVIPWVIDHRNHDQISRHLGVVPDMVFIDGCHEYESAKSDIEFWLKHIQKGGLICGHDFQWDGVGKAVKELLPFAEQIEGTSLWSWKEGDNTKKINDGVNNTYNLEVGLVVAIPFVGRPVVPEWALALAAQNYPLNLTRSFLAIGGVSTDIARNKAVEYALEKKANYIWFLDDDVQSPFFAVRQLIYTLEQSDAMVVGGVYCRKHNPTEPLVYRGVGKGAFWKWKVNDVFEVDGIGGGCMMVKAELFKHLKPPYFKTIDKHFNALDKTEVGNSATEDLYFCNQVRSAGYKILADGHVICKHWDVKTMTPYDLPKDSYPLQGISE